MGLPPQTAAEPVRCQRLRVPRRRVGARDWWRRQGVQLHVQRVFLSDLSLSTRRAPLLEVARHHLPRRRAVESTSRVVGMQVRLYAGTQLLFVDRKLDKQACRTTALIQFDSRDHRYYIDAQARASRDYSETRSSSGAASCHGAAPREARDA